MERSSHRWALAVGAALDVETIHRPSFSSSRRGLGLALAGNEQMVTDNAPQLSEIFGVYLQVRDLNRSLSFYRDVLSLEVGWNDGALAVLHGRVEPAHTLVIREIGETARHDLGEAGVTRIFWRVRDPTDLNSAEEFLIRHKVHYQRHSDEKGDGITVRDPDGLEIVLLLISENVHAGTPPAWLYWYH
jgi:catechol 2,3-dioxygenase-like lactoylglutathione lyase family enzyme